MSKDVGRKISGERGQRKKERKIALLSLFQGWVTEKKTEIFAKNTEK